jgi:hypothetical protein
MAKYIKPSTRNITRLFRTATLEQIIAGADWYENARLVADALAVKYGVDLDIAAGVIAAVSPLNSWGANVNLAARILEHGGLHAGYLKLGLAKARNILAGQDIERTLNGQKTINFYRAIRTAGAEGVCIDRHAYSLAVNTRFAEGNIPTLKGAHYDETAECYIRAARILSAEYDIALTPAQVQSVTWTLWRNKFWSETAWDSYQEI